MKSQLSIRDSHDLDIDLYLMRGLGGTRLSISVSTSDGRFAMAGFSLRLIWSASRVYA